MSGYRILFVVSFAATLLMIGVGLIVALLPLRVMEFSGSTRDVGYLASIFALAYLLVRMPLGRLADRLGMKPFLILGYALCCLSGVIMIYAMSSQDLLLGRFVQGAGEAPIWALGPALLSLAYPHAKGRVIGIYNASIHTGLTLGPLLGILLFPAGQGSGPFVIFAVLCLCGGLTVFLFLPRAPKRPERQIVTSPSRYDMIRLLAASGPLVTLLGILLYGAGYGIFVSVLPAGLVVTKAFDNLDIGILFALFYAAISIAQLVAGPLSDRHGRYRYMIAGMILAASGFAIFPLLPNPWIYVPLVLSSLGLGVFCVASMAYLNECVPETMEATVAASYYLSWGLGYFLGPLVVGGLDGLLGPQTAYLLLALLMIVQACALFVFRPIVKVS